MFFALLIMDVFKGQISNNVLKILKDNKTFLRQFQLI